MLSAQLNAATAKLHGLQRELSEANDNIVRSREEAERGAAKASTVAKAVEEESTKARRKVVVTPIRIPTVQV